MEKDINYSPGNLKSSRGEFYKIMPSVPKKHYDYKFMAYEI
jgi:hypothetical protein